MCRSIKILRTPYAAEVTDEDLRAAALQYVRTVSGFRRPSAATEDVFHHAVEAISATTKDLLAALEAHTGDPAALARPATGAAWVVHRPAGPVIPGTIQGACG